MVETINETPDIGEWGKNRNKSSEEIIKCFALSLDIEDDLKNEIISELKSNPELYISQDSKFTKKFARKLINYDEEGIIIKNLDNFEDLDAKMAIYIMWAWYYKEVFENLDKFVDGLHDRYEDEPDLEISNYDKILEELLSHKDGLEILFNSSDKVNLFIAKKLVDQGWEGVIVENLDKFEDLDKGIAIDLMRAWYRNEVIANLDKFEDKNEWYEEVGESEVLEELLSRGDGLEILAMNINNFHSLSNDIANRLIDAGYWEFVVKGIDSFAWIDFVELAKKFIEKWEFMLVVDNIDKFEWVDIDMLNKFYSDYYE